MLKRLLTVAPLAALATSLLFIAMDQLVKTSESVETGPVDIGLDFLPEIEETEVATTQAAPDRTWVKPPPMPATTRRLTSDSPGQVGVTMPAPTDPVDVIIGPTDGGVVSIVTAQPRYPASLASRGIEGEATVIFDVLPSGSAANIAVLEASHPAFGRSAIAAAKRFRFRPRIVDGVPQTTTGLRYRFTFRMED